MRRQDRDRMGEAALGEEEAEKLRSRRVGMPPHHMHEEDALEQRGMEGPTRVIEEATATTRVIEEATATTRVIEEATATTRVIEETTATNR